MSRALLRRALSALILGGLALLPVSALFGTAMAAEVRIKESKNSNMHLSKTLTALPRPRPDARPTATRPQCRERAAERIARTARASTVQPVRSAPRGHARG